MALNCPISDIAKMFLINILPELTRKKETEKKETQSLCHWASFSAYLSSCTLLVANFTTSIVLSISMIINIQRLTRSEMLGFFLK